jgi:hypothetical protein
MTIDASLATPMAPFGGLTARIAGALLATESVAPASPAKPGVTLEVELGAPPSPALASSVALSPPLLESHQSSTGPASISAMGSGQVRVSAQEWPNSEQADHAAHSPL